MIFVMIQACTIVCSSNYCSIHTIDAKKKNNWCILL